MRYFFVDRIIEMVPGERVVALKNITATEDVFADHFPRFPIYPGALLIETMAQTGGLLIEKTVTARESRRILPVLSIVKSAKFRGVVLPGDSLRITVNLENCTEDAAMTRTEITCESKIVAESQLFYTLLDIKEHLGAENMSEADMVQETLARMSALRKSREPAGD